VGVNFAMEWKMVGAIVVVDWEMVGANDVASGVGGGEIALW
jgi:hypothetical protein